ncbi:MAG: SH3 domain-containing protein [Anaerolineae bacterium]|nr:SH3 domain-containing protein [Anaerolineae bacterium]
MRKYPLTLLDDYRLRLPYDVEYGRTTTIDLTTEPATIITEDLIFENYQRFDALLVPLEEADPRPALPGTRCFGAALSRLNVGGHGQVNSYFEALLLYDEPGGTEIDSLPEGYRIGFTVLDGPVCGSYDAWWQIQTDDSTQTGWIRESNGNQYLVFPDDSPALICEGSLPPRLAAGGSGQVIPDQGANRLRSEPSLNGEVVGEIPAGASFTVLSEPVCADGYLWWQVDYNGLIGWTAEGEGDTYWLQPE